MMVIGAKGQDGSILSRKLELLGHQVVKVSKDLAIYEDGSELYKIQVPSLVEPRSCFTFLESLKPEVILHFAAVHAPNMVEDGTVLGDMMVDCHVTLTKNLLYWLETNGTSKLVVALSSQMYSPIEAVTRIQESTGVSPSTFYGKTKADAFELIREARALRGVNAAGAIFFNHTSGFSKANFLFPTLAQSIASQINSGDIRLSVRNANAFLDIGSAEEYCDGVLRMLELDFLTDFVFSSNRADQISTIVKDALMSMGYSGNLKVSSSTTDIPNYVMGDPGKAKEILGWAATSSPGDVLKDMVLKQKIGITG